MSNETNDEQGEPQDLQEPYTDAVNFQTAVGPRKIVIYPISYQTARRYKEHLAAFADAAVATSAGGATRAGLDDRLLDLMEQCCRPKPSEVEGLPLFVAGECFARWLKLNMRTENWSFTLAAVEEVMTRLAGQPISLKEIWCGFVSPLVTTVTRLNAADGPAGPIGASAGPNSSTEPDPQLHISTDNARQL